MIDRHGERFGQFLAPIIGRLILARIDQIEADAREMRLYRELKAQEKANKLPVQMSGVMAGLMMPALLMICLTPVLIRWIRVFSD